MAILYALTLFVSAFLLFLVQPLVGKMLLPTLGGTPLAWNTCMVFFQLLLLGGYAYSHVTTKWLGVQRQSRLHLALLGVTLMVLAVMAALYKQPISIDKDLSPQGQAVPIFGILFVLFLAVGVPFFTVATSAPLLQRWFSQSGHSAAKDPYFLYAASNVGSVLALVVYPLFMEPSLRLATQSWVWAAGFGMLAVLVGLCAVALPKQEAVTIAGPAKTKSSASGIKVLASIDPRLPKAGTPEVLAPAADETVTWGQRLRWLALAAIPSSLMLGVTTYLVTDIASMPLFWIIPLGIYLFSFIIAFLRLPKWMCIGFAMVAPVLVLFLLYVKFSQQIETMATLFVVHLTVFGAVALMCHTDLARSRPAAGRLTEFFLIMSAGGVLGGLINTLFAPLVFNDIHEYEWALVAACFLVPALIEPRAKPLPIILDVVFPVLMFGLAYFLMNQKQYALEDRVWWQRQLLPVADRLARTLNRLFSFKWGDTFPLDIRGSNLFPYFVYGVPLLLSMLAVHRPWRSGLAVAAIVLAASLTSFREDTVLKVRSQFGVLKVTRDENEGFVFHTLSHGTTTHGDQQIEPESPEPRTYYHPDGPIGDVFLREFVDQRRRKSMAFIGLGTGTLATYAGEGQQFKYFEIDPVVQRIATNAKYFSYYSRSQARKEIVLGDARIQMERLKNDHYDLIIVDAFSSDSIPVHLLTREAIQLYLSRLSPDGVILLHISNRHLKLARVVARLALDLNLPAWHIDDSGGDDDSHYSSEWVMLAPPAAMLQYISGPDSYWSLIEHKPDDPLWTDDFSSVLAVLNWLDDWPWIRRQVRGK